MINNLIEFKDKYKSSFTHGSTFTPTSGNANIDVFYGPYSSLTVANEVFNANPWNKVAGKACGIEVNGKIIEYWLQNNGSELEFVEKTTNLAIDVTWQQLITLKTNSNLNVGDLYRITDFRTTCTQQDCRVSPTYTDFSIMMLATSTQTLDEHVRVPEHPDWDVWYRLENDTTNFAWADVNGKGIIYKMVDSLLNETPYDSVNIEFDANKVTYEVDRKFNFKRIDLNTTITDKDAAKTTWVEKYWGSGVSVVGDVVTGGTWIEDWKKTFNTTFPFSPKSNKIEKYTNYSNLTSPIIELNKIVMESNAINNIIHKDCQNIYMSGIRCDNNVVYSLCHDIYMTEGYSNTINTNSNMIFFETGCYNNIIGLECSKIFLGRSNSNNTFGSGCTSNTLGDNCDSNTFGNNCDSNSFGDHCDSNTFEIDCTSNTFENECSNNMFYSYCSDNTFGSDCANNKIRSGFMHNNCGYTFRDNVINMYCSNNTFGNRFANNIIESACESNTFGDDFRVNIIGSYVQNNVFLERCAYNKIVDNIQYINFGYHHVYTIVSSAIQGTNGTRLNLDITSLQNLTYETKIIKDDNKELYHEYFDNDTEMTQRTKLNLTSNM